MDNYNFINYEEIIKIFENIMNDDSNGFFFFGRIGGIMSLFLIIGIMTEILIKFLLKFYIIMYQISMDILTKKKILT